MLLNSEEIQSVFQDVGEEEDIPSKTRDNLEKFTCKMYGSGISEINKLRFLKAKERFHIKGTRLFSAKENADLSLLPPCSSSLCLHIDRVNYQTLVWKQSLNAYPELPSPDQHGWKIVEGQLVINLGEDMFPTELEEVLIEDDEDSVSEDEELSTDLSDFCDEETDEDE